MLNTLIAWLTLPAPQPRRFDAVARQAAATGAPAHAPALPGRPPPSACA